MATEAHAKKYLILDSVRVLYNEETDTVHLTAKDEDFEQNDQFHIVLSKGTPTERTLRKLLNNHQVIEQDLVRTFPRHVSIDNRKAVNDYPPHIPLGVYRNGKECLWEVDSSPHLLVKGATGSGKSSIGRVIDHHTKRFTNAWEIYGIDTQLQFSSSNLNFKKVAKDLKSAQELVESLSIELSLRYDQMTTERVINYRELRDMPKTIMLLVEDFNILTTESNPENMPRFDYLQYELARETIIRHLTDIARMGRAAGIHLALFSPTDIDSSLGELKSNITGNISFGNSARGRGIFNDCGDSLEFQAYYVPND